MDTGSVGKTVDVQPSDGDIRAGDGQAIAVTGLAAAQLDQRRATVARLGETVDQDRVGDRGQRRERSDRLDPGARDGEVDRVRRSDGGVGIDDRLTERAGAEVAGIAHQEGRQERPVLHHLEAGAETKDRRAEYGGRRGSSTAAMQPLTIGAGVGWWAEWSDHFLVRCQSSVVRC